MPQEPFIPVLCELARTYQAFESYSSCHIRTLDLTPSQFDIIATLGNTDGMSFRELGEKTLITKGTLTGVVDRLEAKNLVCRVASPSDGRSQIVQLTRAGEKLFGRVFPAHLEYMRHAFSQLSPEELAVITASLRRLREAFTLAQTGETA